MSKRLIDYLKRVGPTLIIPKKKFTVRFISDFRELNKTTKTKSFPIP